MLLLACRCLLLLQIVIVLATFIKMLNDKNMYEDINIYLYVFKTRQTA